VAVTRKTYTFEVDSWQAMPDLQKKLNQKLGGSERIVFMGQQENRSNTWYVVTEELIMGPSSGP
jgi:hypothetical protein